MRGSIPGATYLHLVLSSLETPDSPESSSALVPLDSDNPGVKDCLSSRGRRRDWMV